MNDSQPATKKYQLQQLLSNTTESDDVSMSCDEDKVLQPNRKKKSRGKKQKKVAKPSQHHMANEIDIIAPISFTSTHNYNHRNGSTKDKGYYFWHFPKYRCHPNSNAES